MNVLIADAQFEGEPDIEREVFADCATVVASPANRLNEISDATLARADGLICYHHLQVTSALLGRMPRCRYIVRAGVGFDNVDIRAAAERNIPVSNVPDYGTLEVADHSIAMTMTLLRGVSLYSRRIFEDTQGGWDYRSAPAIRRLSGTVFGALGLGRIGLAAAVKAKALGMDVLFYDPFLPTGFELSTGLRRVRALRALLEQSHVLSIFTPLTDVTRRMIDAEALKLLPKGAIVVNTARGPIVDTAALRDALLAGHVAAAALDVLPDEEDVSSDPLIQEWRKGNPSLRDRVVVSPHAAFFSPQSLIDLRRKSAETMREYLLGNEVRDRVN